MSEKKINRGVALGVFLVTAGVYLKTLSTTVVFWDVGEFCAAARLMQVPHPPGAPLFVFLARIASLIPYRDDIAARMHAVSAIGSAFGVMFLYLISVKLIGRFRGPVQTVTDRIIVYGSSAVGALALAFSTTYWDNSIEAEVYGMGMFFVSFCLWLALRWWERADEPHNEKYLLLIAYMLGLSTGIHILALLATIPILMIVYFRRYEFSRKSFLKFSVVALVIFFVIYPGIVQTLPGLLDGDLKGVGQSDLFPFVPLLCVLAAAYVAYRSYRTHHKMVHIAALSFLLIVIGYTSYTEVIIRANVDNLPMKENNPNNLSRLTSYLTREQYGDTPMLKGESWDNETQSYVEKLFPRRYSMETMHEPTRVNYSSDADFFWRYQVNHMFVRYVLWNFVGAEGDWQDAGVSWKETFGIPFFLAMFGLYFQLRRDPKMGSVFVAMFIIMGIVLDLYQNQQDPQPRERDYFYVGAYYVMCVWIAIGIVGIFDFLRQQMKSAAMVKWAAVGLVAVSVAAVPLNLARVNWREHDRSQNYIAWDYSYNLLQSVDKDAILFTNGDNDTFPLWYLQDVEGVRRDVRVVNLSLINTQWYIHLLKNDAPHGTAKVAMSFSDDQIEKITQVRWNPRRIDLPVPKNIAARYGSTDSDVVNQGKLSWMMNGQPYQQNIRYLRVQDIMVRDIIVSNKWVRPVFFAVTCAPDSKIGLDNYLWMEGLALELRPVKLPSPDAGVDMKVMEANFMPREVKPALGPQHGYLFRNLNNPAVYYDDNVQRMVMNYRAGYMRIADYYSRLVHDSTKARQAMDRMEEVLPLGVIPMMDWRYTYYIARILHDLGNKERFEAYATAVETRCQEVLNSGQYDQADGSSNPYLILAEVYGMRKDYARAIDMLNNLAMQYPDQNGWIKNQIAMYDRLQKSGSAGDSNRVQ